MIRPQPPSRVSWERPAARVRSWVRSAIIVGLICAFGITTSAAAQALHVTMLHATGDGPGVSNGTVTITQTEAGAVFALALKGLPPGVHGFHVHENASCGPTMMGSVRIPAGASGSHWDPEQVAQHGGPDGPGHLGDLPLLEVAADGTATQSLTAPRIKDIARLKAHSLVIDMGGDNYKDQPLRDGGGGLHLSCGAIGE
ncbi:MAG: superoxide dismutase family protein [Acetobacteraceae bacterium]|nr:superoxide dismutase family protein [Acetobacteraceae bacterium]